MTELSHRQPLIAVYGSSTAPEGSELYGDAVVLGRELAQAGFAVMTGGYGGIMAACSRGAHEAGGHVVGVTVDLFEKRGSANPWVRERVHTPDLYERLRHIVSRADGFVTVSGSIGTLNELFLTWTLLSVGGRPRVPLVLMGPHWHEWLTAHRTPDLVTSHLFEFVEVADTPHEAAQRISSGLARMRAVPAS